MEAVIWKMQVKKQLRTGRILHQAIWGCLIIEDICLVSNQLRKVNLMKIKTTTLAITEATWTNSSNNLCILQMTTNQVRMEAEAATNLVLSITTWHPLRLTDGWQPITQRIRLGSILNIQICLESVANNILHIWTQQVTVPQDIQVLARKRILKITNNIPITIKIDIIP